MVPTAEQSAAGEPTRTHDVVSCLEGEQKVEQHQDRERRIGAFLLLGLAAFVFVALATFYLKPSPQELSGSIRDRIVATR
jgi:hypothetical protein